MVITELTETSSCYFIHAKSSTKSRKFQQHFDCSKALGSPCRPSLALQERDPPAVAWSLPPLPSVLRRTAGEGSAATRQGPSLPGKQGLGVGGSAVASGLGWSVRRATGRAARGEAERDGTSDSEGGRAIASSGKGGPAASGGLGTSPRPRDREGRAPSG